MSKDEELYTITKDEIKSVFNYLNSEKHEYEKFKKNSKTFVTLTVFSMLIAFVWKDAIRSLIVKVLGKLGMPESEYFYEITFAVVITMICLRGIDYFMGFR